MLLAIDAYFDRSIGGSIPIPLYGSFLQPEKCASRSKVGIDPLKCFWFKRGISSGNRDLIAFLLHLSHFLQAIPRDGARRKTPIEVWRSATVTLQARWRIYIVHAWYGEEAPVASLKKRLRFAFSISRLHNLWELRIERYVFFFRSYFTRRVQHDKIPRKLFFLFLPQHRYFCNARGWHPAMWYAAWACKQLEFTMSRIRQAIRLE